MPPSGRRGGRVAGRGRGKGAGAQAGGDAAIEKDIQFADDAKEKEKPRVCDAVR